MFNFNLKSKIFLLVGLVIFLIITLQTFNYLHVKNLTENRAVNYSKRTITQAKNEINNTLNRLEDRSQKIAYNPFVRDFLNSEFIEEKIKLNNYVENIINNTIENNSEITAITLLKKDDWDNFYGNLNYLVFQKLINNLSFNLNNQKEGRFETIFLKNTAHHFYLFPIYDAGKNSKLHNLLGTVLIKISSKSIMQIIDSISINQYTDFFIVNNNGRIISSNLQNDKKIDFDNSLTDYQNNYDYISQSSKINSTGWLIYGFTSQNEVNSDLNKFPIMIIISGLIFIILLLAIALILNDHISKPVEKIASQMDEIGNKNTSQRIDLKINGELGIIVKDANKMLDKIEKLKEHEIEMNRQIYETKLSQHKSELAALQSQINPHFLYNTLECMRSIAAVYESQEIIDISTSMADIFRYNIKGDKIVTVEEEIEIIKSYLKIMQIRFPTKFYYKIKINEEIVDYKILKMTLQPIIENSVYHGLTNKKGKIIIKGSVVFGNLLFIIKDTGSGIAKEKLKMIKQKLDNVLQLKEKEFKKDGIGILNINKRLKLQYGAKYGLKINSKVNQETIVKIIIPIKK